MNVGVKRFTDRAGFLGPIQYGDTPDRSRQCGREVFGGERTVQPDLDHTDFFTLGNQLIDCLVNNFRSGTHDNSDMLGLGMAEIIEQAILASDDRGKLVHVALYYRRCLKVISVNRLPGLEEYVRVLRCPLDSRAVRREGVLPVLNNQAFR